MKFVHDSPHVESKRLCAANIPLNTIVATQELWISIAGVVNKGETVIANHRADLRPF
jgi:hypothetical protein